MGWRRGCSGQDGGWGAARDFAGYGFGCGAGLGWVGSGGVVGIVEAGETVGDDLGGGFGVFDGFEFGGVSGGGLGLGFGGGGSDGEIVLGLGGQVGLGAGDDEDLFELGEVGGGIDLDEGVGLVVGVGGDGLDGADGKAAGVDLVAAGGEDCFAGLDAGVGGEVVDDDAAGGGAAEDGADASAGEQDAGAGGLVVDEEDLGGVGEDVAELADDAVGGDDGLIGLEAVVGCLCRCR